ncbi:MAG: hydroxysqualene dehydroxylase HpnE [Pseudomonadota bacterium]|jgi:squalene-associated FAD-dependent desaturase
MAHLVQGLNMPRAPARVAVIGAGYGGLAAAVELATRGIPVTVFEASRTLGGRARVVERNGVTLDNGQHILIGAYRELLRLMAQVGAAPHNHLQRLPLTLLHPGRLRLQAPRLPAPLHLLTALITARGLRWEERRGAMRFMRRLRRDGFRLPADTTVADLLDRAAQPDRLCRYLWEPLCLSALNTPPQQASAQVFVNVLRDSLAAERAASDLLLPRTDLSQLFPEPAVQYLTRHGGEVLRTTPIHAIRRRHGGFDLDGDPGRRSFAAVILAVAPYHAPALLGSLPEALFLAQAIAALAHEPILTCYLHYREPVRLPAPMVGGRFAHWLFDRGRLGGPTGLIAGVISAGGAHEAMGREQITSRMHEDVCALAGALAPPQWSQVITEKRATFRCLPSLARPGPATPIPGLYLCGDYVALDYPATLESAVRAGVECARLAAGCPSRPSVLRPAV